MIDFSFLTQNEIKILKEKIPFSRDQIRIFDHLVLGDKNDEGIMMELCLSRNKYYKIKNDLINKIVRAAVQS